MAYPTEIAPPIPWEIEGVSLGAGLLGTLRQAFSPTTVAPALGHGDVRAALGFALVTWLPLAALQGIIPYTRTLVFGEHHVAIADAAASTVIALDLARAMSLGVLLGAIQLGGMGLAFASLGNAFGQPDVPARAVAWRTVLYRAFVVLLLPSLMAGGLLPSDLVANLMLVSGLFEPTLYVLVAVAGGVWLLTTLRTSARLAMGMGPSMSFLVPFLVLAVGVLARLLTETALQPLMPPVPEPTVQDAFEEPRRAPPEDTTGTPTTPTTPATPATPATPGLQPDPTAPPEPGQAPAPPPSTDDTLGPPTAPALPRVPAGDPGTNTLTQGASHGRGRLLAAPHPGISPGAMGRS
ncbi:MAG: hypothetical protein H6726_19475 [Sandaracinaceae bacterium]|nr:hypothetical protein [Sandaracinaceae bacterium]